MAGGGGGALEPPKDSPWDSSFGSALLCSESGETITLQAVRYLAKVDPLSITPILRDVPDAPHRGGGKDWAPILMRLGRPTAFVTDPHTVGGRLSRQIAGRTISRKCTHDLAAPRTELVTVMRVGQGGGWITGTLIDYEAGGHDYTLRLDWTLVACGTRISEPSICAG